MAEQDMAHHGGTMDYSEHETTYKFFVGLVKWGSIAVAALLILMAHFLVH
ncbi:MAG: aa3-type cytochrome c oxidase subunit IV [Ancalomicrobiaceae bacterium]|nr:aa3-type cytochrome c oxidase subunit IV [Ancalomicrobiaceae bacterium]